MANHLGAKLSRLIKERAYLAGSIPSTQHELEGIQSMLEAKSSELSQKMERLTELDRRIVELSAINVADIRAIKAMPRVMNGEHGSLRREIIKILKSFDEPVSSGALVEHIAAMFGYPMDTVQQRAKARKYVRDPLNLLKKHGVVVRHPSLNGSTQGRWQWVGARSDS